MSAAPVSRSSALPETTLPSRRAPERSEPGQAFALPQEPAERPRPDDDRGAREGVKAREPSTAEDPRRTTAADSDPPARVDDEGKAKKTADAKEPSGKAQTEPVAEEASATDDMTADGKTAEAAAGDKPAKGKTEEGKAGPAVVLDGVTVIGKDLSGEQAAAAAGGAQPVPVPAPLPAIAAEFLTLAALALQGGEPAKPDADATPESKPEGQVVAAASGGAVAGQQAASGPPVPAPAGPVAVDGQADQAGAAGEAVVAASKVGVPAQPAVAGVKGKVEAASGEAPQAEAKAADGQVMPKEAGEPGKATPVATGSEVKVAEPANAAQPAPPAASDVATPAAGPQQAAAPMSPQAILAAGPQSLVTPQAPLTELDAAAQATAQAQAEVAHKMLSGDTGRATPLHVVPVEIGARALAGNKRFDIRLDPAELGRIDVSLEISDKGEVSAKLVVDRVETLHMLQRDARTLERAFEQAGLKPSDGGIDMNLRDSGDQQAGARQQRQDDEAPRGRRTWVQASDDSALVGEVARLPRNAGRLGGVDLSI